MHCSALILVCFYDTYIEILWTDSLMLDGSEILFLLDLAFSNSEFLTCALKCCVSDDLKALIKSVQGP